MDCLHRYSWSATGGCRNSKSQQQQHKKSCLALVEDIWQHFHSHLCCSSHKGMCLTNVAPFKRKTIAKKHYYTKEIIYQRQISSFVCLIYLLQLLQLSSWHCPGKCWDDQWGQLHLCLGWMEGLQQGYSIVNNYWELISVMSVFT